MIRVPIYLMALMGLALPAFAQQLSEAQPGTPPAPAQATRSPEEIRQRAMALRNACGDDCRQDCRFIRSGEGRALARLHENEAFISPGWRRVLSALQQER